MSITGESLVTTAGTPVPLATPQAVNGPLMIKALNSNTDLVYVCGQGDDGVTGMHLLKNEFIIYDFVGDLSTIYVDSLIDGEGVRWALLVV